MATNFVRVLAQTRLREIIFHGATWKLKFLKINAIKLMYGLFRFHPERIQSDSVSYAQIGPWKTLRLIRASRYLDKKGCHLEDIIIRS